MSHLVLVRHGQASFLEKNYDRLSPKGEQQSLLLGEYWAQHKIVFEKVYSGPKIRQRETARIAGEGYRLFERPFTVEEARGAREAFLTSTTADLLPVVRLDGKPVGDGKPGPLSRKLRDAYLAHAEAGPESLSALQGGEGGAHRAAMGG